MSKLKGQFIVEKRNDLNEMRAVGWTLQELKYLSLYLSKINARVPETRKVKLSLENFANIMGISRYDVRNIRTARDGLLQKIAVIPFGNCGERAFQLFRTCDIDKNEYGEWYIEFEAHDEALPLMFEFKEKYVVYEVANVLQLQSTNHIRMYEILKQYEKLNKTTITLEELRKRLGIKPEEYTGKQGWKNFKIWVIDKCQKALAENTDIKFTYEPIRYGRKIGAVNFFIEKNHHSFQISLDEYDYEPEIPVVQPSGNANNLTQIERKAELEQAKQSDMWHYALSIAKKNTKQNKNITATPERYAIGVLNKWKEKGYKNVSDLRDCGEISQVETKASFDLDELDRIDKERQRKRIESRKHENY